MDKDIIKSNDNTKAVNQTREAVNSGQIEETQKKSVSDNTSTEKLVHTTDTGQNDVENFVSFKDYSGKIKYDSTQETQYAQQQSDIIKAEDNSNIIKSNDISESFKHKDNVVNDSIKGYESGTVSATNNGQAIQNSNYVAGNTEKAFKYTDNFSKSDAMVKTNKFVSDKGIVNYGSQVLKDTVISNAENSEDTGISVIGKGAKATFATIDVLKSPVINKENLVQNSDSKKHSDFRKNAQKKAVQQKKEQQTTDLTSDISPSDTDEHQTFKYVDENQQFQNVAKVKSDKVIVDDRRMQVDVLDKKQNIQFSATTKDYLEQQSKVSEQITSSYVSEQSHSKLVKDIRSQNVKEKNKFFNTKNQIDGKEVVNNNNYEGTVFNYVDGESKTGIKPSATDTHTKSSNQKSFASSSNKQTKEKNTDKSDKVTSDVDVPKSPKIIKGDIRRGAIDKNQVASASISLGIKSEMKNQFNTAVLKANQRMDKIVKNAQSSIKQSIKQGISEAGEDDMAFKAVDYAIQGYDTIVAINNGIEATANTVVKTANGIKNTAVTIKNLPKNIAQSSKIFKDRIKRLQKLARMKNATKSKLIKRGFKQLGNKLKQEAIKATRGLVIKLIATLLSTILGFMACGVLIISIFYMFTWQTETELDTTEIIKYIAEQDATQQKEWYKGKTGVEIEKADDYASDHDRATTYSCYYYLAENPPIPASNTIDDAEVRKSEWVNNDGTNYRITYASYFDCVANSKDEFLEKYRMTTDDYRATLAYLQVKNENLGWFAHTIGFVGESILKSSVKDICKASYGRDILTVDVKRSADDVVTETIKSVSPIAKYENLRLNPNRTERSYYYFGTKYSVKYLIENDIVRFDDDDTKNASMKEQFKYTYKYGNMLVANLEFPLQLEDDEKLSDRIVKHFGKQYSLTYTPPDTPEDASDDVYGTVKADTTKHYAIDLSANYNDVILAPIDGLCKATQREKRGFEYTICTSYDGNDFDYTQDGYLIKISCSNSTYISSTTPKVVKKGDWLGLVQKNTEVNYSVPSSDNDTEYEDLFADKLFPCSTGTTYSSIGKNVFTIPYPEYDHIHVEMYKLPCDFTDASDIEKNVLDPELFFDYSNDDTDVD